MKLDDDKTNKNKSNEKQMELDDSIENTNEVSDKNEKNEMKNNITK